MRLPCKNKVAVKDRTIGGAIPLICLPLVAKEKAVLLRQAEELRPLAPDLIEWRIDGFDDVKDIDVCLQTLADLRAAMQSVPLIFTCRIDTEGGIQKISQEKRLKLIRAAIQTGIPDIVDIELCNDTNFIGTILKDAKQYGSKVILSFHDFEKTPEEADILDRLVQAQNMGAHIAKAAVMPNNHNDIMVLLNATLKARTETLQIPIITMSMGKLGLVTRIVGGLFGSDITFAMGKDASSPGQIPVEDIRKAMAVIY
ncbi:MAG: type I 3-dehydroquinate dehydratase [Desulfobacterales bacterium]|nr:type I 3-dehydroquinate dehydratase [Desulfobacterales bacterium]